MLDDQLNVLSSQPHLGPPNEGPRPHTGVHRRTLRQILLARLGESFRPGRIAVSYEEQPDGVRLKLDDGSTAEGDVLVGADGIRSAIRGQRLPGVPVIDAGIRGLGVYGRSPLTPGLRENLPSLLLQGVIIAADRRGSRMLLAAFQPRRPAAEAAAELAPDVTLEPVEDYLMVSCSVAPGTVIPPAGGWTGETPALLREPEPGRVLTESDTGSSAVTTFTVSPQGGASLVQISTTWDGAHGIGGFFERMFAPRVMRAIYLDELSRLDAYAREHRSA